MSQVVRIGLVAVAFGVLLYFLVFFLASRGEAFNSFVAWSKTSTTLQARLGEIKDVRLKLSGSYSEKTYGDSGSARFVARVTGTKSSDDVNVEMTLQEDIWSVSKVEGSSGAVIFDTR